MSKYIYEHHCHHCGHKWKGTKEVVVSCVRCKRRLDDGREKVTGKAAALKFVEFNLISSGVPPRVARSEAKRRLNAIIGFGGGD